jgi:hypothetical protein
VNPKRVQLRRTKGWRKPEGAVVVARPSRWGNPWTVGPGIDGPYEVYGPFSVLLRGFQTEREAREAVVRLFRLYADGTGAFARAFAPWTLDELRDELAGKDLACWCPLKDEHGQPVPCHADVLLELANVEPTP